MPYISHSAFSTSDPSSSWPSVRQALQFSGSSGFCECSKLSLQRAPAGGCKPSGYPLRFTVGRLRTYRIRQNQQFFVLVNVMVETQRRSSSGLRRERDHEETQRQRIETSDSGAQPAPWSRYADGTVQRRFQLDPLLDRRSLNSTLQFHHPVDQYRASNFLTTTQTRPLSWQGRS